MTAELALALPALVLVLAFGASAVGAMAAQVRCVDAARDVARELARGETVAHASAVAAAVAPGSSVSAETAGDLVRVVVTQRRRIGVGPLAATIGLRAEAVTRAEAAVGR